MRRVSACPISHSIFFCFLLQCHRLGLFFFSSSILLHPLSYLFLDRGIVTYGLEDAASALALIANNTTHGSGLNERWVSESCKEEKKHCLVNCPVDSCVVAGRRRGSIQSVQNRRPKLSSSKKKTSSCSPAGKRHNCTQKNRSCRFRKDACRTHNEQSSEEDVAIEISWE